MKVDISNKRKAIRISKFSLFLFCVLLLVAGRWSLVASPANAQEDATNSVREKVRQAIENLSKKPRAVVGSLDNVSDSTLQIKNLQGKISLVATDDKTVYAKFVKGKKSDIKFEDLTIGDFTVALGYKNSNDTLDAARVLTFDKSPFTEKKVLFVQVDSITKNSLSVSTTDGDSWTVDATKAKITAKSSGKLQDATLKDISEGDTIIAVGTVSDKKSDTLLATRIHVVHGTASVVSKASPKATPLATSSPKASPKPSPTPAQ